MSGLRNSQTLYFIHAALMLLALIAVNTAPEGSQRRKFAIVMFWMFGIPAAIGAVVVMFK